MNDSDWDSIAATYTMASQRHVVEYWGTDEQKETLRGLAADKIGAFVAAIYDECVVRRDAQFAADALRRDLDQKRLGRLSSINALVLGDFPVRLIRSAVGHVPDISGDPFLDGSDKVAAMDVVPPDTTIETPALGHAREFVAGKMTGLLLAGGVGSGKTHAATWATYVIGERYPGFIRATELERRGRYDHDLTKWIAKRGTLVIDDVGVEPMDGKGYFLSLLDEIIDQFWGSCRRLILTTNLTAKQFADRYSARTWSRLCEMATIAECGKEDLRRGGV